MKKLNDLEIRQALVQHLRLNKFASTEIVEELHICNGRAIADIVTLKDEPHCYEIKGDGDKLERLLVQNEYYKKSFRKITLVTTERFAQKATAIAPGYWGIIVINQTEDDELVVRKIRSSRVNPHFDKAAALLTLWKSEILDLVPNADDKMSRNSRTVLANLIAETKEAIQISRDISSALSCRINLISRF